MSKISQGKYAEYLVKLEFLKNGLDVYTAEVDNKGIDFVLRIDSDRYFDVQVKSVTEYNYAFIRKSRIELRDNMIVALVHFLKDEYRVYLIPSKAWENPNNLLANRDYKNLPSSPEYGINMSQKNLPLLENYAFDTMIAKLEEVK